MSNTTKLRKVYEQTRRAYVAGSPAIATAYAAFVAAWEADTGLTVTTR